MRRGKRGAVRTGLSTPVDYVDALGRRLLEEGLAARRDPARPGQTMLIACGALAREVDAIVTANGWTHAVLDCLPAKLHNAPQHIPEAVRAKVRAARERGFETIFVLYADCGTGGALDRVCAEEGVERLPGPHCYAFFEGVDSFERLHDAEPGTLYLTDFFARQFDALIWRAYRLDHHPELIGQIFGGYDRVVHLAQTEDPALDRAAREAAARLGLRHERRATGYGDLATTLHRWTAAAIAEEP